jgi:hypothetical protein
MEKFLQMVRENRSISIFIGIVVLLVIGSWLGL